MPVCIKLEWAEQPRVEPCAVGEPADYRGLKIYAIYDDGSRTMVDVTARMFNESNLQTRGTERKSFIVYEGQRLPVLIPLKNTELDHIEVTANDGMTCREGEWLDRSQIKVSAFYADGTIREVEHYKTTPFVPFTLDQKDITIRYGRCRHTIDIMVVPERTPEELDGPVSAESAVTTPVELALEPTAKSMCEAEKDETLLPAADPKAQEPTPREQLKADPYQEQSPQSSSQLQPEFHTVASSAPVAPIILKPVIPQKPTQPLPHVLESVSVAVVPSTKVYLLGDTSADLSGGVLDLHYRDGVVEQVPMTADNEVKLNSSSVGRTFVSFFHQGKLVSFPVIIEPSDIKSIEIKKMPVKAQYEEGEMLDLTGMELLVTYACGIQRPVSNLVIENFPVTKDSAPNGLTLALGEVNFTVPITINEKEPEVTITDVKLLKGPTKNTYIINEESLDMTGAVLSVSKSDGSIEHIQVDNNMIVPVALDHTGKVLISIVYEGFEELCPVFVVEKGAPPAKASVVQQSVVAPVMVKESTNPAGLPLEDLSFYPSTFCFRFADE